MDVRLKKTSSDKVLWLLNVIFIHEYLLEVYGEASVDTVYCSSMGETD
jgi:hypothetical protein